MGRTKSRNPKRNADTLLGATEQLGALAAATNPTRFAIVDTACAPNKEDEEGPPTKKKRVRYQEEVIELLEPSTVPAAALRPDTVDQELTIESSPDNDTTQWTIRFQNSPSEESAPFNAEWILREYSLVQTQVRSSDCTSSQSTFSVKTSLGASTLLQHCESFCGSDSSCSFSATTQAVEDGTLQLDCVQASNSSTLRVVVALRERAFEVCSADRLPLHKRSSKKYQSSTNLHHALAELFADSVVEDAVSKSPVKQKPISAKTVYNLVDNVKLQEYEESGGYDSKSMSIPGLVPTLRPYQEAAVKWMLQRERNPSESDEWELAWVVLAKPEHGAENPSPIHKREVVTLGEWKTRTDKNDGIFYCPFAGYLAKSSTEAYRSTFLGLEKASATGGILAESMGLGKSVEVLACVLAHRRSVHLKTPAPIKALEIEEEKKESGDERNDVIEVAPPMERNVIKKWVKHFGPCICGSSSSFRGCLSIVLCQSCREPMHGVCAGFISLEHLEAETYLAPASNNAYWTDPVVPICSSERCPTCVFTQANKQRALIESRATLIVTPAAILTQWQREIRRHVSFEPDSDASVQGSPICTTKSGLKVLVYPGIRELCNQGSQSSRTSLVGSGNDVPRIHLIHPHILADADIVLMTFDALMGDLGHSDDNPYISATGSRRLRAEKRYRVLPSPLTGIQWFRVCLDEAQKIETPTATTARMALKLAARHRWCVSGTPIGRGSLDDLYGLFSFLKLGPFSDKKWFQLSLNPSYRGVEDRIIHLLSSVLWRSTKGSAAVKRQIGIPEQTEKRVVLKFSSIEKHFYERQLEATLDVASNVLERERSGKARKTSDDLLASHLHQLRAACCHPQVGSRGIARSRRTRKTNASAGQEANNAVSVSSGVLTMDQILDRLIDDARVKCEESQRLAVMHTNALASLEKLRVEARRFGVNSNESDEYHLTKSCRSYLESLEVTDANARPTTVVGEAVLTGCKGFLVSNKVIRDGKTELKWHLRADGDSFRELWSRFDFEGPSKKIVEIKVRLSLMKISGEEHQNIALRPKDCSFQVSSSAVGGEFVDVVPFTLPDSDPETDECGWLSLGGFRTNRSKSWRVLIKNYHGQEVPINDDLQVFHVGLDLQLFEADIASDSLQRLHVLHNASLSLASLIEHNENKGKDNQKDTHTAVPFMSVSSMKEKVKWMHEESRKIESLYMDAARSVHRESQRQLKNATRDREEAQRKLLEVSPNLPLGETGSPVEFWGDEWWNDLLSMVFLYGGVQERSTLCDRVRRDLGDFVETLEGEKALSFPDFRDVDGIKAGLDLRLQESLTWSHVAVMQSVSVLSPNPSEGEISNNAHCEKCRADWNQTGPECRHCKLETKLNKLDETDPIIGVVLKAIYKWLGETNTTGRLGSLRKSACIDKRAKHFFEVLKLSERELRIARRAWRTHFDLLSDLDEMNQCKRTIRLAAEDEDLTKLSADELGSIVTPWDIAARAMDHAAKQAMALATLRRNKDTLRYLKNQNAERIQEREPAAKKPDDKESTDGNVCILCLSPFEGERAVLSCGHSFHYSPCLEKLMAKAGNHHAISCPLRCTARTMKSEVMIASEKSRDDGSKSARKVTGSWGTKVTRLLSDIMDVSDRYEKSIVFSQWEDMLDVVEEALSRNGVEYVRAKTLRKIGDCIKVFRSSQCSVLLLNVKNGAEGLTLVEATHVFMIEPLLNPGLDSQAINRIHRIGQRQKTYVHRYLIQDTIEMKIDKMRMEHNDDQLEDALNEARKKHAVSAGGIDGGFSHEELQEILK